MQDLQIVENFFDDIEVIQKIANSQKYYDVEESNFQRGAVDTWPGKRTLCLDESVDLQVLLEHNTYKKFNLEKCEHAYFFHKRGSIDNSKDWIHKDSSKYALIVYLSKTNLKSGTTFYNENKEIITEVGFVQNRAILFNGKIPHKSKLNYGENEDIRLTLNGFFYDKK